MGKLKGFAARTFGCLLAIAWLSADPETHGKLTQAQRRVFGTIERYPGIPLQKLAGQLGITAATAAYHVGRLEEAQMVHSVPSGRRRLIFVGPPQAGHLDAEELAMLRHPSARAVARAVLAAPHDSARRIGSSLTLSRRAYYHQLKRLRDAGLVRCLPEGAYRSVAPSERLVLLLERLKEEGYAEDAPSSSS